jgi:hypothetical protein
MSAAGNGGARFTSARGVSLETVKAQVISLPVKTASRNRTERVSRWLWGTLPIE